MKAILVTKSAGPDEFQIQEVPIPDLKGDEVLIKVKATAVNGSDLIERKRFSGESLCMGIECSGTIEKIGENVQKWNINDEPELQVFPLPSTTTLESAACLPYAACTVWSELFTTSELSPFTFWLPKDGDIFRPRLSASETLLVHDDSNGIASFAIQLAKCEGVTTFVTSSEDRRKHYGDLGVYKWVDYNDFVAQEGKALGQGVDVILNVLGPGHFQRNLSCLNKGGRLISIGDFCTNNMDSFGRLPKLADDSLSRKLIGAAAFRHRSRVSKELIVKEVQDNVWPHIEKGMLKPSFHSKIFTFSEVKEAHQLMESGQHFGKILLVPDDA
ncbi:putative beta-ketoacyl-[acyl-carrier-protein] synthase I [Rosa chinensis]|uniref:Putative beta-ketoacyl-[acyl-carrier-protein] synthase I n=1 Tax=Rosa chinensis TaxID=74649 RepID=A0A2P6Q2S8_ROSCH|nr:putative beta-ketoacyl-[acyl-carrier-protein] synthase I [Rosa chinensis]